MYTLEPAGYGNLVSQHRGVMTSFFLFDGLGSSTQLTNSAGSVTDSYLCDSFANVLVASGATINPFKYVGRPGYYYDTDLLRYFLRARFYDPAAGRFLSRDSLGISSYDINSYVDSYNNPVIWADPSGLQVLPLPPTDLQKCLNWAKCERERGTDWLKNLSNCPCSINVSGPGNPKSPQPIEYTDPEAADPKYHPGAQYCIRTVKVFPGSAGQQCCFDKNGNLITGGPGAGTPDLYRPGLNNTNTVLHFIHDVNPFFWCSSAGRLDIYLKYRPPNQGNKNYGQYGKPKVPCPTNIV